ncbi:MAG TPA: twin-arginine translocation signal domain-containing protein, partial [Jatrophihabitans sp.]
MPVSLAERIVNRVAERTERARTSRRGFLGGAALVGAALAVNPWSYLTRPASAYDTVCGADANCYSGYSVFCCTINGGRNSCPPDSFIGGWWKADNSSFCRGSARYYIDCNAYRDGRYACRCNQTTCDRRLVACNQFRYGQCNTQIPWSSTGPVLCRMVTCTPPWVQFGGTCSSSSATDNNTGSHTAPCIVNRAPVGYVDQIASTVNTVRIKGWTYDPD